VPCCGDFDPDFVTDFVTDFDTDFDGDTDLGARRSEATLRWDADRFFFSKNPMP